MKKTTIGYQGWQKTNLKETHFRNGEPIMKADDPTKWLEAAKNKIPAYCIPKYKGKEFNNAGYLYNWYAVNDPRGLAPQGWLIPGESDAKDLLSEFENARVACIELKSKHGWMTIDIGCTGKMIDGNGTNKSGFNAKPIPYVDEHGQYSFYNSFQSFWLKEVSCNPSFQDHALELRIGDQRNRFDCGEDAIIGIAPMSHGLAVRCLKDPTDHLTENAIAIALDKFLKTMETSIIKREVQEIILPYLFRAYF